jgi:hypothetical protein
MAPIVVAGPVARVLAGWLEGTLVGGTAAVGGLVGALGGLGIPKDEVLKLDENPSRRVHNPCDR